MKIQFLCVVRFKMFKIILDNTGDFGKNVAERITAKRWSGSNVLQEFIFYG